MAQPDLIAQKLLGTDPQVGFGDSAVTPYRKHELDTSAFDALERAKTRREKAAEDRKKDNEDFLNQGIKNLSVYDRAFQEHMDRQRSEVLNNAYESVKSGRHLKTDPNFINAFTKYQQDAAATNQIAKERDKIMGLGQGDLGKYVNVSSYKGAALKNYDEVAHEVNSGNSQALQSNIAPNPNDPEHFKFDEFIHDKTKDIKGAKTANDTLTNGALGQLIKHTERGYKFYTHDANGNIVPGIDKSVVDYFLNGDTQDQDMLQFRTVMDNLADKYIENKALQLKNNDPAYADMGIEKIKEKIAYDPNNKNYVNKDGLKEKILKDKLEPYQEVTEKNGIRSGHSYPRNGRSGDNEDVKVIRTFDQSRTTMADTGNGDKIVSGWVPEELRFEGKKMDKPLLVNSTKIYNEETNQPIADKDRIGDNSFKPTRLMLLPYNIKTNKYIHNEKDAVLKSKNIQYKWVAAGTMPGKFSDKKVFIPYEEVQPDIKAQYGVDLDERSLGELSDLELTDKINQEYPNSTPEQKLEIFKNLRSR
jgi:hypothetical protein